MNNLFGIVVGRTKRRTKIRIYVQYLADTRLKTKVSQLFLLLSLIQYYSDITVENCFKAGKMDRF